MHLILFLPRGARLIGNERIHLGLLVNHHLGGFAGAVTRVDVNTSEYWVWRAGDGFLYFIK